MIAMFSIFMTSGYPEAVAEAWSGILWLSFLFPSLPKVSFIPTVEDYGFKGI